MSQIKKRILGFGLFGLAISLPMMLATPSPRASEKEPSLLNGTWRIARMIFRGIEQPNEACQEETFVISDNQIEIYNHKSKRKEIVKISVNEKANPKEIDLDYGLAVVLGIYKIENGRLFLSRNETIAPRPTSFTPMSGEVLMRYEMIPLKK